MTQAKKGDTVKVNYTGKLQNGTIFDTSENRDPLQFTIGQGQVIPDFEEAIVGMTPGESKTFDTPADRAYGPHYDELVVTVGKDQFPPDVDPEVGEQFQMVGPDGRAMVVIVTGVEESEVTLDANHPLAGEDLTFDIELVEIG